ncbi:MAG: guanylate kinase [Clostridia bacterium]|nr:guanylate kinase [Clostridia bacterium]
MRLSKGRLYIVSGPSGAGKDTVLSEVFQYCPEISFSISSVTRPMRPGEIQGEKYNFISKEKFEQMITLNQLLEHNVFVGNYYGTPKEPVEKCLNEGKDMIIEIDVNGAAQIKKNMPQAISIFIMPPSFSALRDRLTNRGTDSSDIIERRITVAYDEIARATEYDYIVVNDDLGSAVQDFVSIIKSERLKTSRCTDIISEILNK